MMKTLQEITKKNMIDDEGQGAGNFSGVKVELREGDYGANCSIGDLVRWFGLQCRVTLDTCDL